MQGSKPIRQHLQYHVLSIEVGDILWIMGGTYHYDVGKSDILAASGLYWT